MITDEHLPVMWICLHQILMLKLPMKLTLVSHTFKVDKYIPRLAFLKFSCCYAIYTILFSVFHSSSLICFIETDKSSVICTWMQHTKPYMKIALSSWVISLHYLSMLTAQRFGALEGWAVGNCVLWFLPRPC